MSAQGINISKKRAVKLMKKLGIAGAGKKRRRQQATVSSATHPVAERLFKMEMNQAHGLALKQIWVVDITYIRLVNNQYCYLGLLKKYVICRRGRIKPPIEPVGQSAF